MGCVAFAYSGICVATVPDNLESLEQSVISRMQEVHRHELSGNNDVVSIGDVDVRVMNTGLMRIPGFKFYDVCVLKNHSHVSIVGELDSEKILVKISHAEKNDQDLKSCPSKAWVLVDAQFLTQWEEFQKQVQRTAPLVKDEKITQKAKEGATTLFKSYWVQQTSEKNYGMLCHLGSGMKVFGLSREAYVVVSSNEAQSVSSERSSEQGSFQCSVGEVVLYAGSHRLF